MLDYSLRELAIITGGELFGDAGKRIGSVSIDTRTLRPDALYVPIHGRSLDGHDYIPAAFSAGAACTLCERASSWQPRAGKAFICVDDSLAALQSLARDYRRRFDIPVVAITGSVGKTTTKDMVALVMAQHFNTLTTIGNLNNQTGVPQVLFMMDESHEAAVLELGTNHFGEIERLSWMTEPTHCLFTCIGDAHLEFFGSREGIVRGKYDEMLQHARPNATVIVNGEDELLIQKPHDLCYGIGEGYDICAVNLEDLGLGGTRFTCVTANGSHSVTVHAAGRYMVLNALAAAAVAHSLGVPLDRIARGIESYRPRAGRMGVTELNGLTLLDGCYNANPNSVKAGIETLCKAEGRKVVLFGDMLELGSNGPAYHREVGEYARDMGVDLLLTSGPLTANACVWAGAVHFDTRDELIASLPELLHAGDTVLVKASLGMGYLKVVEYLKQRYGRE